MIGRYQFADLYAAAAAADSTAADRIALVEWFELYDIYSWNGECYDLEDGYSLYPILEEQPDGDFVLVDAEIR